MRRVQKKMRFSQESGFTLIEMVVSILIMGAIVMVAIGIFHVNAQTYVRVLNRSMLMAQARQAASTLRSDLQKLSPDSISVMDSTHLAYWSVDGEFIEYQIQNGTLKRNDEAILSFVNAPPFIFLDDNLQPTEQKASLKYIRLKFLLKKESQELEMRELIYVRN